MMQDKALALTYTQIGGLTSILPVAYGMACLSFADYIMAMIMAMRKYAHVACHHAMAQFTLSATSIATAILLTMPSTQL